MIDTPAIFPASEGSCGAVYYPSKDAVRAALDTGTVRDADGWIVDVATDLPIVVTFRLPVDEADHRANTDLHLRASDL